MWAPEGIPGIPWGLVAQMFQGETAITIDDKGRLAIPVSLRELVARDCGNRLVITYNPYDAGCLWLYPEAKWSVVRDPVNALTSAIAVHRRMQMKLVGAATPEVEAALARAGGDVAVVRLPADAAALRQVAARIGGRRGPPA